MTLVSLTKRAPQIVLDMRYATTHNIARVKLYETDEAFLDGQAADALAKAASYLDEQGYQLVVWDAYRSLEAHQKLRQICDDSRYVSEESSHCKGLAVDVTLEDDKGRLDMGTDHDDFSEKAHPYSTDITNKQQANRKLLRDAMTAAGFTQWPYEWWHYEYVDRN